MLVIILQGILLGGYFACDDAALHSSSLAQISASSNDFLTQTPVLEVNSNANSKTPLQPTRVETSIVRVSSYKVLSYLFANTEKSVATTSKIKIRCYSIKYSDFESKQAESQISLMKQFRI